jgi:hypothetical protein
LRWNVRIDTPDARDLESEFDTWSCEWTEECSRCTVNMDRHIDACFLFILVEKFRDFLDRLIMAGISRSKDYEDACLLVISVGSQTDGIFIEMFTNFADIETVIGFLADRNNSCLNFEITGKFPGN